MGSKLTEKADLTVILSRPSSPPRSPDYHFFVSLPCSLPVRSPDKYTPVSRAYQKIDNLSCIVLNIDKAVLDPDDETRGHCF